MVHLSAWLSLPTVVGRGCAGIELARDESETYNDDLRNDPWAVEKVAREEYGMIKEGETCYRVVLKDEETK